MLKRKVVKKVFQDYNGPDLTVRLEAGRFTFSLNRMEYGPPLLDVEAKHVPSLDGFNKVTEKDLNMQFDPKEAREIGRILLAYADAWGEARKWYDEGELRSRNNNPK